MCQISAVAISSVTWLSIRVHSRPSTARGSIHHLKDLKSMMTTSKSLVKASSIGTWLLIRGSAYIRLFQQWAEERNVRFPGEKVPADLLATDDHQTFPFGCANFEIDGTHYPPRSIQHYLMGIQCHIRVSKQSQINSFTNSAFISLIT